MEFITNDGMRLEYDDVGSGQPVVILTGLGGSRVIWGEQVKALISAGFRVINIDARNQGASQHTTKGMRISRHSMDLWEIMQKLELEKPILLGNSMGASTIFGYVSLFGSKDIKAVIDVDQSPKMICEDHWTYGFKGIVTWKNFPDILKAPFGRATYHKLSDDVYQSNKRAQAEHPYDAQLNLPFLRDHAFQDWRDVISELECPLLIIAGEKSPYFDHNFAPVTAKIAPNGSYQIIPESGHMVMAEQPSSFNAALFSFFKENNL